MSQEGEWFLAGILDGIADGTSAYRISFLPTYLIDLLELCPWSVPVG